jgi:hypothetical protein
LKTKKSLLNIIQFHVTNYSSVLLKTAVAQWLRRVSVARRIHRACNILSRMVHARTMAGQSDTSHLTPHTSHLKPHTSHLTPHTSHLTPHTSHLTPHTSHLKPHTSHLTPHTSHLTPHTSHLTPSTHPPPPQRHFPTGLVKFLWAESTPKTG